MAQAKRNNSGSAEQNQAETMINLQRLPEASGIYLITCGKTKCTYVGSSNNIRRRIKHHLACIRNKRYWTGSRGVFEHAEKHGVKSLSVKILCLCEPELLRVRELQMIHKFNPPMNGRIDTGPTRKIEVPVLIACDVWEAAIRQRKTVSEMASQIIREHFDRVDGRAPDRTKGK